MSQPTWHWQNKVERLQKVLEQNALNGTFEVCTSSVSDGLSIRSVNESLGSEWSTSPSNVVEQVMDVVNFNDFEGKVPTILSSSKASTQPLAKLSHSSNGDKESKRVTSNEAETAVPKSSKNMTDSISLLELIKSSVVKVIDEHIDLVKDKAATMQQQQDRHIERLRKNHARKTTERRNCVQRIRTELNDKINNLNNLLNELEEI